MAIKPIMLAATVVLGLGCVLHIVGLATPQWMNTSGEGGTGSLGLWELCFDDKCVTLSDKPDWLNASEAMAILGMLSGCGALFIAGVMLVMSLMDKETPRLFGVLALLASIASCAMIIICVAIFAVEATKLFDAHPGYGYSFGLSVTGAILILIGGIIALIPKSPFLSQWFHQI